jgi:hypothetical protein
MRNAILKITYDGSQPVPDVLQIACDEDHAVFGPCCHDGSLLRDGQSSCDLDGVTGVCNALGQCV